MRIKLIIVIFLFILNNQVISQNNKIYAFPDCNKSGYIVMSHGDTLFINCPKLWVYSYEAEKSSVANAIKADSLDKLKDQLMLVKDSINVVKDSIIVRFENIKKIQDEAFNAVNMKFNEMRELTNRAVKNTEDALGLIKKIKFTSYATSGVIGGIAGGLLVGKDSDDGFSLLGSLVGAATGIIINHLVISQF